MILAASLDPLYLVVAVPAFILAFGLFVGRLLHAGLGDPDDDAGPVICRDKDGNIAERLTYTPGAPHAKRYRVDRRRSANPNE